jgi:peptidoglycan/xylan/chitin deacetylase (PgdA/CDA1 family)
LLNLLFTLIFHILARKRLSVMIFHRVLPEPDALFPDEIHAKRFNQVCGWLKSWFNVIPLDQAIAHIKEGTLPPRSACITFDDGYADNYTVATPILQRHGLSATFFIATGFLDGGRMWNDTIIETVRSSRNNVLDFSALNLGVHPITSVIEKRAAISSLIQQIKYRPINERIAVTDQLAQLAGVQLPKDLMMSSQQVKAMRLAGMQIGAHTVSHPILATLNAEAAREEIWESKQFLEQLLGERIGLFAYPNGKPGTDYSQESVQIVRELGFDAAVSTTWGAARVSTDMFQIPRFTPWDRNKLRFGVRFAGNLWRT